MTVPPPPTYASVEYALLDGIARETGTDKSSAWHDYTRWYARHLPALRCKHVTLLEIGVMHGQSLQLWRTYFGPGARIVGVENNTAYVEPVRALGFEVHEVDQRDEARMRAIADALQPDVVIDDGSHNALDQRASFRAIFPVLKPGAIYAVEDLLTAYRGWGGDFMRDVHAIVDDVHNRGKCDWGRARRGDPSQLASLTEAERTTVAVHCYPSLLLIEKGDKGAI